MDICRICLAGNAHKHVSILEAAAMKKGFKETYSEILSFCLDIQVTEDSNHPSKLCRKCVNKVVAFYEFKAMALKNDSYLRLGGLEMDQHLNEGEILVVVADDADNVTNIPVEIEIDETEKGSDRETEYGLLSTEYFFDDGTNVKSECCITESETEVFEDNLQGQEVFNDDETAYESDHEALKTEKGVQEDKKDTEEKYLILNPVTELPKMDEFTEGYIKMQNRRKERTKPQVYACNECDRVYYHRSSWANHVKGKHLQLKEHCDICDKDVRHLKEHMLMRHERDKMQWACGVCGRRFLRQAALRAHTCKARERHPFACTHCDKTYREARLLKRHIRQEHTGERNNLCHICSKIFPSKYLLNEHLRYHSADKAYKCEQCKLTFATRSKYNYHKFSHMKTKKHKCAQCDRSFHRPNELRMHVRLAHERVPTCWCDYCSQGFLTKTMLIDHIARRHPQREPVKCPYCDKVFFTASQLKTHQYTHAATQDYHCPHCPRKFNRPACLNLHIRRVHEKEKTRICHFCSKAFFNAHDLKEHISRAHTTEKRFDCPHPGCGKKFNSRTVLTRHKYLHSESLDFHCDECPRSFISPIYLHRHMKSYHPKVKEEEMSE